jgi:hypothetical protein
MGKMNADTGKVPEGKNGAGKGEMEMESVSKRGESRALANMAKHLGEGNITDK